jgi:hypothetical protein
MRLSLPSYTRQKRRLHYSTTQLIGYSFFHHPIRVRSLLPRLPIRASRADTCCVLLIPIESTLLSYQSMYGRVIRSQGDIKLASLVNICQEALKRLGCCENCNVQENGFTGVSKDIYEQAGEVTEERFARIVLLHAYSLTDAGAYDYETVHSIINASPILHVSFNDPEQPFPVVLPMLGCTGNFEDKDADASTTEQDIYIHGYVSGRIFRTGKDAGEEGLPITIAAS